ncbi:hypothetical protein A33M_2681 [Rhodovulum sp. PH10]|nr:hypothetical protein A33M_2681 [Rhodovulum sp. PH10]
MAAAEPRQRHPAARPQPEPRDRLLAIGRAGRQMPALRADPRRQHEAIQPDHTHAEKAR